MSTNPIIIEIVDKIDPSIAGKIKAIGLAARQATNDLTNLQNALTKVSGGTTKLSQALNQVNNPINNVNTGSSRLATTFGNLISRLAGVELGMGRLGGAAGSVGTQLIGIGPLIVAALSIAAVTGAILIYEKFAAAARALTDAQIDLEKAFHKQTDRLLEQKETLIGLTEGPLAKYRAELADLSQKSIEVNSDHINKVLEEQKSKWADLVAVVQTYSKQLAQIASQGAITFKPIQEQFSIQDAQDFIKASQLTRVASKDQRQALVDDLEAVGAKLVDLNKLEQQLSGRSLANTEVSRKAIQAYYTTLTNDYKAYLNEHSILQHGSDGEFLAQQRQAARDQLTVFEEELSKLKTDSSGVVSPQQRLSLQQNQLSRALPLNVPRLNRDVANDQQAIEKQSQSLANVVRKFKEANDASAAYSDALKAQVEIEKEDTGLSEKFRDNSGLNSAIEAINRYITASLASARVDKEKVSIYGQFVEPLLRYNAALAASQQLLKDGAISSSQAAVADAQATRAKEDAINPLNEYMISLSHEVELLGQYGQALTVATEVDRVRQQLQRQGYDLDKTSVENLTRYLTLIERLKNVQQSMNVLWEENAGAVQKLVAHQLALNKAVGLGIITEAQYKIATAQTSIALADQAVKEQKNATLQNQLVAGLGKYLAGYQGLTKGISDAYGQAFQTIADGAATSIGRAIVFADDLGAAMINVARTAAAELIGAFIKLGIQFLINELIAKTVGAAITTSAVAQGTAVAAAWASAAAFVSLATFGANAAPAIAGLSTTVGIAEALSLVGKFAGGGFIKGPGTGTSDSVMAALSNGEFVVNAKSTAQHRGLLESINNGATAVRTGSSSNSGTKLNVTVVHDGSTSIRYQQVDENTVRIIAKQESRNAVQTYAPNVIAADLQNPNSRTSKAVSQNINAPRKR